MVSGRVSNLRDLLRAQMLHRVYGVRSIRDMAPASADMALDAMGDLIDIVATSDWLAAHDADLRERIAQAIEAEAVERERAAGPGYIARDLWDRATWVRDFARTSEPTL